MKLFKFLFNLALFTLVLAQLTSLSKSYGNNFYVFDVFVFLYTVYGLFYFLVYKNKLYLSKTFIILFIFSLLALSSLILNVGNFTDKQIFISLLYLFRWVIYLLSGLVTYNAHKQKILDQEYIYNLIIYSGIFLVIGGIVQLIVLPDFTVLDSSLGWDPHKNRLSSSFFDPNFLGAYIVICLSIIINKLFFYNSHVNKLQDISGTNNAKKLENPKNINNIDSTKNINTYLRSPNFLNLFAFIFLLIGLFLTFSRSAWGMFGIVILIYGIFKSKKLIFIFILIFLFSFLAIPRIQTRLSGITDPSDSASLRLVSWRNTYKIISKNLITGVGFNTFRYVQRDYGLIEVDKLYEHGSSGSDSSLLFIFATTGVFGLITYLLSYLYSVYVSYKIKNLVYLSIFVGLLFESNFINSLFYPQIMFILLYMLITSGDEKIVY